MPQPGACVSFTAGEGGLSWVTTVGELPVSCQVCTDALTWLLSNYCHAELFEATGSGANAALLQTVIIGVVNVASTVVAIVVVDR